MNDGGRLLFRLVSLLFHFIFKMLCAFDKSALDFPVAMHFTVAL